MVALAGSPRRD